MSTISDPRIWPAPTATEPFASLNRDAEQSLAAATRVDAERHDAAIRARLEATLDAGDGTTLAAIFDKAPSAAVYRHLWRELARVEAPGDDGDMRATLFALPLTIIAGRESGDGGPVALPCVLHHVADVAELLRAHGALGGNETFALANALVAADAIDIPNLPAIHARRKLRDDGRGRDPLALTPAPIVVDAQDARVHVRFLVGVALTARGVDLIEDSGARRFAMPLTRLFSRVLAHDDVTLLILPQAPKRLTVAVQQGRAAQREVSAQLFASNALRRLRASVGEPTAVVSAHRAPDAVAGGELRVSLSSPFDPGQAEGFRCPLYRADQPSEVGEMLITLLRDCRVDDIRVLSGVHADRDPATGLRLLFKADTLALASKLAVQ